MGMLEFEYFLLRSCPPAKKCVEGDSLANEMDSSTDLCRLLFNCLIALAVCSITGNFACQAGRKNLVSMVGIGFGGSRSTVFHAKRMCLFSIKLCEIAKHCSLLYSSEAQNF